MGGAGLLLENRSRETSTRATLPRSPRRSKQGQSQASLDGSQGKGERQGWRDAFAGAPWGVCRQCCAEGEGGRGGDGGSGMSPESAVPPPESHVYRRLRSPLSTRRARRRSCGPRLLQCPLSALGPDVPRAADGLRVFPRRVVADLNPSHREGACRIYTIHFIPFHPRHPHHPPICRLLRLVVLEQLGIDVRRLLILPAWPACCPATLSVVELVRPRPATTIPSHHRTARLALFFCLYPTR